MRRIGIMAAVMAVLAANSGCFINMWSSDPTRRARELIVVSENLRLAQDEWERFWLLDQPDHCTPYRIHGGIQ